MNKILKWIKGSVPVISGAAPYIEKHWIAIFDVNPIFHQKYLLGAVVISVCAGLFGAFFLGGLVVSSRARGVFALGCVLVISMCVILVNSFVDDWVRLAGYYPFFLSLGAFLGMVVQCFSPPSVQP